MTAKMTPAEVRAAAAERHYEPKILDNADRGDIAEEIVAGVLGPGWEYCSGQWASWDFEHLDGTRMQIKQSAARQTWDEKKKTVVRRFGIAPQTGHWVNGTDWIALLAPRRLAEIYVFAWHGVTDETCDHADPAQWRFYAVPAAELPNTKTITLDALRRQWPDYDVDALPAAVEAAHGRAAP